MWTLNSVSLRVVKVTRSYSLGTAVDHLARTERVLNCLEGVLVNTLGIGPGSYHMLTSQLPCTVIPPFLRLNRGRLDRRKRMLPSQIVMLGSSCYSSQVYMMWATFAKPFKINRSFRVYPLELMQSSFMCWIEARATLSWRNRHQLRFAASYPMRWV